jgi:adenylate cyclase
MDCFLSRWTTMQPGGFSEAHLAALRTLVPALGLAIKSTSLARIAATLVETYLGRDAGKLVLEGRMTRGMVQKLHAVIWFSDMKGYTALSESIDSDQLIPLLNDYADAVIAAVHGAGGDVLKLIGDGVLATFTAESPADACRAALVAEAELRARVSLLRERRRLENLPTADVYIGLHLGDVYYGNIGSKNRLDFTVIGQAVNEASRIASMCQSAGRSVLVSSAFRDALPAEDRDGLVSVGRYALRGLANAQDLFTVEAAMG